LHYANGPKLAGLFWASPATWAGGPSQRRQGRVLGQWRCWRWSGSPRCEEKQMRGVSERRGRKGGARRRGAPHIAARGGGRGGGNSGRRIRWVARRRPRCCGRGQGGGGCCMKRSARSGSGRPVVQTGRLTGGPRWFLYYPRIIQTGSNLEIEKECHTLLQKFPNCANIQFSI
jgi:hypothetical protein